MRDYVFRAPPEPIGYWIMPGGNDDPQWQIKFTAYKKPRWHQRYFMNLIFGWQWEDA
jgi:hypothetical protein